MRKTTVNDFGELASRNLVGFVMREFRLEIVNYSFTIYQAFRDETVAVDTQVCSWVQMILKQFSGVNFFSDLSKDRVS